MRALKLVHTIGTHSSDQECKEWRISAVLGVRNGSPLLAPFLSLRKRKREPDRVSPVSVLKLSQGPRRSLRRLDGPPKPSSRPDLRFLPGLIRSWRPPCRSVR